MGLWFFPWQAPQATETVSLSETLQPLFDLNTIAQISDHPHRSILHVVRGDGPAQFGGIPVVCESEFHTSFAEYQQLQERLWPQHSKETFIPAEYSSGEPPAAPPPLEGPPPRPPLPQL